MESPQLQNTDLARNQKRRWKECFLRLRVTVQQGSIHRGFKGKSWINLGYRIYLNSHIPYFLPYMSLQQVHFTTHECVWNCWMSGKQCRPWSDAAFCGIWSGSTLFAKACLLKTLRKHGNLMVLNPSEIILDPPLAQNHRTKNEDNCNRSIILEWSAVRLLGA